MKKSFETRLKQVQQLPYILIVGEGEHRFHVVHADLLRPKDASGVLSLDKYDGELRQRLSHCCLDHGAYQSENRSQYGLMMINANTQAVHIASYLPI